MTVLALYILISETFKHVRYVIFIT